MSPRHYGIKTLDHYAHWVDQTIQQRGGTLDNHHLEIEPIPEETDDDEPVAHLYPRQWITLAHGYRVGFDKLVDRELNVVEYHYEYRQTNGQMIVELHNHRGHEKEVGGRCHMHVHEGGVRRLAPAPAHDFDEALHFFALWPMPAAPPTATRRRPFGRRLSPRMRRRQ